MSKLAPVTTGQPTQGMGTVPASRAVAASSKAVIEDLEVPGTDDPGLESQSAPDAGPSGTLLSPRNHYSAHRAAATATWLSLAATELEVRNHFRSVPVQHGLETLAKMRKQCDLAAEALQGRIDDGNTERCSGCDKTLEEARKSQWIMQGSEVDPDTGVPMPYRYCGVQCVRERNREKMLPPDQRNKKRFDGQEEGDIR
ncbi:MAG: hypothetical protein WBE74_01280 [Terracidiphilus sp.]